MNNESPLKRMVATVGALPTAYLESMSYYECITYLVKYVESVISTIDDNSELVKELQEEIIKLKQYMDNYFASLDIQQEIDNKLDEMADQGELTQLILDYLDLGGLLMFNTKADMKAAENLVDGSFAKTLGDSVYNDGYGFFYKIRELQVSDVPDDDLLVALTNYPELIAEKVVDGYLADLYDIVGDLGDLTTTDKTSVVNAINEVNANVGDLTSLPTTDKDSIVDSISELDTTYSGEIGDLDNLTTSTKTSIVGAVNELNSYPIFNFTNNYHAYRTSSDGNTTAITLGKFNITTSTFTTTNSGMSNVYCNIFANTNADGSVGKIYGQIFITCNYSLSTTAEPCLRFRCEDFGVAVPDEGYTIWAAGNAFCQHGYFHCASMYIGSDGYIYMYADGNYEASSEYVRSVYNPCLYFFKDFGDTPAEDEA